MKISYIKYDFDNPGNDTFFREEICTISSSITRDCDGIITMNLGGLKQTFDSDEEFVMFTNLVSKFYWNQFFTGMI